ncbi:histidine phosphatase family protein [Enterococcus hirae]|nr:histidine phosphatase family protein [Enterococcaceae bacterium]MCI1919895.1 histidine phosphatase family protein [Enterococcaceae bacterium]MDM8213260.1 histidine phosphatase family protein [Enterococcus hirae]
MSNPTTLYIVRHGKTMFNAIGRTQGWSDTPLTREGVESIHYLGLGLKDTPFAIAYSSDSGRAIQTSRLVLGEHNDAKIPYFIDQRIREWCFGSLDGGYDGELWGVVPRVLAYQNDQEMWADLTYEKLAGAIQEADTTDWSEPYETIKTRIWNGFEDIAQRVENRGGGNALIVSHGMTISHLLYLIDPKQPLQQNLENASVTRLTYSKGKYEIEAINDMSYLKNGQTISQQFLNGD